MAEKLNMSQASYSRAENHAGELSIRLLQDIAKILEVKLENLVSDDRTTNYYQNNKGDNHAFGGHITINQYPLEKLKKMEEMLEKIMKKNELE